MPEAQRFRVNSPLVAMQEIEGEAILINFDTGSYYSANVTGTVVLDLTERGESVGIAAAIAAIWKVSGTLAIDTVSAFLNDAAASGLVVLREPGAMAHALTQDPPRVQPTGELREFIAPRIEKFDDLQDLLMLDPIHDVDQAGWPMPAPNPGATPPQSPV